MRRSRKSSIVQGLPFLVLLGLLAGALGGMGIGLVQTRTSSSVSSTTR
jgi:hypothetical protein